MSAVSGLCLPDPPQKSHLHPLFGLRPVPAQSTQNRIIATPPNSVEFQHVLAEAASDTRLVWRFSI
jgi:hypothetical protein